MPYGTSSGDLSSLVGFNSSGIKWNYSAAPFKHTHTQANGFADFIKAFRSQEARSYLKK